MCVRQKWGTPNFEPSVIAEERRPQMVQPICVNTLRQARRVYKKLRLENFEVAEEMHEKARIAYKDIIQERMSDYIDRYMQEPMRLDKEDRRNGYYQRNFLTELGNVELAIPRTRRISACKVLQKYCRRTAKIEEVILAGFVLGLSTRKVGKTLLALLGEKISPSTVSRVAKTLDKTVALFHKRPLRDDYEALFLDGVVLSRKTGAGAQKRPVLVALGLTEEGKKEIIDYRLANSESEEQWRKFLDNLYRRGLEGNSLNLIIVDGGKGLEKSLDTVYPDIPIQRCWAHRIRNFENKCKKKDWEKVKLGLHKIMNATTEKQARSNARKFANKWISTYPSIVKGLSKTLDDLLVFFMFKDQQWRKMTRTTNAIERRFKEVRRRTRPMGVFSDRTSMDRILFAVFRNENQNQGVNSPFLALTQNI